MASTIKLKNGSGAPTTGDLVQGEPALDLTNKRLYTENASGVVIEVGTNPSTIDINAGTIDGTVIGGSTAAAGTFTTGQFNTSLNVDGTTNLDVVDIDGAVDMASTLTVGGTTNDGTTLAQIVQSGTGRAFSVNRNVASATRAVVNIAQLQASGGAEAVLDIQQTTPASRAIKVTPDGSIDRFSVYGTGALVTTPVAGGHAVFNEGGADADFRVESDTNTHALFVQGSDGNVGINETVPFGKLHISATQTGRTTAGNVGNLLVLEDDENGMSILSTDAGTGYILFGDTSSASSGGISYEHSANKFNFRTNDAWNRMILDSSGNLLVGKTATNSATAGAEVRATGALLSAVTSNFCGFFNRISTDGTIIEFAKNDLSVGSIGTAGGDLTVGTGDTGLTFEDSADVIHPITQSTGAARDNAIDLGKSAARFKDLYLSGNAYVGNAVTSSTDGSSDLKLEGNQHIFRRGSAGSYAEKARIDSSGNLLVGRSSAGAAATDNGHVFYGSGQHYIFSNATECVRFYETSGSGQQVGSISITSSATAFNTSSDERLKENITDAPAGNVDDIKVRSFDWKADGSHQDYGMVAQELEAVAPYAVTKGETEDDMWSVDYSKLVPMLIKEIQDLKAEVAALKGAN
jgi:hypothetical protein